MLYFFFNFFETKYIATAPAYFAVILSVKLKFPAASQQKHQRFSVEVVEEIKQFLKGHRKWLE